MENSLEHGTPQDAVDGGDLVEIVARAVSPYIDNEGAIDAVKLGAAEDVLSAIPSISFDEAVEKGIEANRGVIGIEAHSSVKSIVRAAIRALTANGDVLIRRE